jgi:hypothetical protein
MLGSTPINREGIATQSERGVLRIDSHVAVKEHNCFTGYQPAQDALSYVCSSFAASAAVDDHKLSTSASASAILESHSSTGGMILSPKGSSNSLAASVLCETPKGTPLDSNSPKLSTTKRRKSNQRSALGDTPADVIDYIEAEKRKHGVGVVASATKRPSMTTATSVTAGSATRRSTRLSSHGGNGGSDSSMEVVLVDEEALGNGAATAGGSKSALKRAPSLRIDTSAGPATPPTAPPSRPLRIEIDGGPAYMLVDRCLADAAELCGVKGMTAESLRALPQGEMRREIIDDVTVMVLRFR